LFTGLELCLPDFKKENKKMAEAFTEDGTNVQARDNVPMTGGAERLDADMRGLSVAGSRDLSVETMQQYLEQQVNTTIWLRAPVR